MNLKQIFCKHDWKEDKNGFTRICLKCNKLQHSYCHFSLTNPVFWWR